MYEKHEEAKKRGLYGFSPEVLYQFSSMDIYMKELSHKKN